ncbi:MAG: efflux RND transporter periplasmic adaptor subunit [Acidobacteria bacterium]|nr:efflux RND transporter periplasmic adaptor subunit [Acidobacteriota bacterium]
MKRILLVLAAVLLVTASVAAYYRVNRAPDKPEVAVATVTRGDVVQTVDATGTLQAVTTVQVGSQVSGTIKALRADFNSRVRKGQVIAELDPSLLQAQVEQTQAALVRSEAEVDRARILADDAQVKVKRARELFAAQLIPRVDLETAESAVREAEASIKSADAQTVQARASLNQNKINLAHAVITAPIDGIVVSRNVDVGQTVAASMSAPTLFVIAQDLTQMQVSASVDESDIGRIESGQDVTFQVDAYPGETFSGTVTQVRLNAVIEQNVVSYVTVIDVPNPELKLKPGMTANVTIEIQKAADVLRVPSAALRFVPTQELLTSLGQQDGGRPRTQGRAVWVLAAGHLNAVPVHVGISDGVNTAIDDGALIEGASVATGAAVAQSASATPAESSPLLPRFPGGNRGAGGGQRGQNAGGPR